MVLVNKLLNKKIKMSVVGLGYVGMPVAVSFARFVDVIGFDISKSKIELYKNGIDPTNEVGDDVIKSTNVFFTSNEEDLKEANIHIVAVPTPINEDKNPNLNPLISATEVVGRNLVKDSLIIFESTVYPGVTEEICVPILEKESGLTYLKDFKVGYSPERINPGDKVNRLETITKVVSASDKESLEEVANLYKVVVTAGVYKASSIKVAEAAKVIENSQRDINIAFMNELSIIFNKMNIDTLEVLKAASTKWNFLKFSPGLVGGHCIGIDPYYLTFKAEKMGYHPEIILAGRKINDNMGKYIVESLVKELIKADVNVKHAKVGILGFTFKENVPDTRNTRVIDIVHELKEYGIKPLIYDPVADKDEALKEYNLMFNEVKELHDLDALVIAVNHDEFKLLKEEEIKGMFNNNPHYNHVLVDVKGLLDKEKYQKLGFNFFRL